MLKSLMLHAMSHKLALFFHPRVLVLWRLCKYPREKFFNPIFAKSEFLLNVGLYGDRTYTRPGGLARGRA